MHQPNEDDCCTCKTQFYCISRSHAHSTEDEEELTQAESARSAATREPRTSTGQTVENDHETGR